MASLRARLGTACSMRCSGLREIGSKPAWRGFGWGLGARVRVGVRVRVRRGHGVRAGSALREMRSRSTAEEHLAARLQPREVVPQARSLVRDAAGSRHLEEEEEAVGGWVAREKGEAGACEGV